MFWYTLSDKKMDHFAMVGDLDSLIKLHNSGESCTIAAMDNAACNGHFEIVKMP